MESLLSIKNCFCAIVLVFLSTHSIAQYSETVGWSNKPDTVFVDGTRIRIEVPRRCKYDRISAEFYDKQFRMTFEERFNEPIETMKQEIIEMGKEFYDFWSDTTQLVHREGYKIWTGRYSFTSQQDIIVYCFGNENASVKIELFVPKYNGYYKRMCEPLIQNCQWINSLSKPLESNKIIQITLPEDKVILKERTNAVLIGQNPSIQTLRAVPSIWVKQEKKQAKTTLEKRISSILNSTVNDSVFIEEIIYEKKELINEFENKTVGLKLKKRLNEYFYLFVSCFEKYDHFIIMYKQLSELFELQDVLNYTQYIHPIE